MIDLNEFRKRFPHYTIRSQPAQGCGCNSGVRTTKDGHKFPCLCVCMSPPEPEEPEYRATLCKQVGAAAQKAAEVLLPNAVAQGRFCQEENLNEK